MWQVNNKVFASFFDAKRYQRTVAGKPPIKYLEQGIVNP